METACSGSMPEFTKRVSGQDVTAWIYKNPANPRSVIVRLSAHERMIDVFEVRFRIAVRPTDFTCFMPFGVPDCMENDIKSWTKVLSVLHENNCFANECSIPHGGARFHVRYGHAPKPGDGTFRVRDPMDGQHREMTVYAHDVNEDSADYFSCCALTTAYTAYGLDNTVGYIDYSSLTVDRVEPNEGDDAQVVVTVRGRLRTPKSNVYLRTSTSDHRARVVGVEFDGATVM